VPTARGCLVSFTGHEEAVMAVDGPVPQLRLQGEGNCAGTRLTVAIKQPGTIHEVQWGKIDAWLQGDGRSPAEQGTKIRLVE
jgi:hypothetical protein